jgi:hypothetical protein
MFQRLIFRLLENSITGTASEKYSAFRMCEPQPIQLVTRSNEK